MPIYTIDLSDQGQGQHTEILPSLAVDSQIDIYLRSLPSTGYEWHIQHLPEGLHSCYETGDEPQEPLHTYDDNDPPIGGANIIHFSFRVCTLLSASSYLELARYRRWIGPNSNDNRVTVTFQS